MNKNTIIINKIKVKIFLIISFILLTLVAAPIAGAEVITVTENGANSSSEITTEQNNQSNTQQSNNSNINNTVTSTTETGNNSADNNTNGDTIINTGTASQTTSITNEVNKSAVDQTCCSNLTSTSINISGNSTDSQNNATNVSSSQTIINVIQNATIINNIKETASTGNNSANNNTGNVTIHTGDIKSTNNIINSVNSARVSVPNNHHENSSIKISNNGHESENSVVIEDNKSTKILTNNSVNIKNDINSIFKTGNNTAEGNIGTIDIRTGDIKAKTVIQNDLNINKVDLICCNPKQVKEKPVTEKPQPQPQPTPNIPPTQPTPNNPTISPPSGPSNPTTQIGQVAGVALSSLPTTGNNWLFFSLLGNIIMLFLGAYLRLRSGNSPGFAFTS